MSECPIHRVGLLLGRCWMCRGVPPGGTPNRPPAAAGPAAQSPQEGAARVHELKCWPVYFQDVRSGRKNFEVRENDRGFRVGDVLRLREWDPSRGYSGEEERRVVTYVLESGLFVAEGYVVLALAEPGRSTSDRPLEAVASADPELALRAISQRITEYLSMGGLWNPELADHRAVSNLLQDARDAIDSALSRLAGQSTTANENDSGAAARGLPEEES
jgi:hypothetical protein